jgi:hypothetical protein
MHEGPVHEYIEARYFPHEKDGGVQSTDRPAKSPTLAGVVVERTHECGYCQRYILQRDRPLGNLFLD